MEHIEETKTTFEYMKNKILEILDHPISKIYSIDEEDRDNLEQQMSEKADKLTKAVESSGLSEEEKTKLIELIQERYY